MLLPNEGGDRKPGDDRVTQGGQSLGDALAWLDRHVNLEAIERGVAGRAAEPTLERIAALVSAMDDPQSSYPVIHVTGTNGKGSTSRLASQLLMGQGLTVGTYSSPHLETVNERIALDGVPITDGALADLLGSLQDLEEFLLRRPGGLTLPPTWFELVTAAAYRHFADVAVEAAVVEVGIGGLYDATNVADGVVAVLTNVSLDHVEILGPSLQAIAREKAGIVKPGAIVVLGEVDESVAGIVAEEARRVGATAIWRRRVDFDCVANRVAYGGRLLDLRTPGGSYDDVFVPLHGAHQGDNAAAALAAAEAFFAGPLDEGVVSEAFARTTAPGRLEVVGRHPLMVLDGAHNAAGAQALGAALEEDFAADRVVAVLGCLRGRDPAELLGALGRERVAHVVACAPPSPRALPAEDVAAAASGLGVEASVAESVEAALGLALGVAGSDDLVLVTGSLYLVGAARTLLRRAPLG